MHVNIDNYGVNPWISTAGRCDFASAVTGAWLQPYIPGNN